MSNPIMHGAMVHFRGYTLIEVPAGTVIVDGRTERREVVSDGNIVMADAHCYCTPTDWAAVVRKVTDAKA